MKNIGMFLGVGLPLAMLLNFGCRTGSNEDAPRLPERDDLCLAWERGTNLWSEELFRRMNVDESRVTPYTLPELPDSLAAWEKSRPLILQQFKDCMYGVMPPAPDRLDIKLLSQKDGALGGIAIRKEFRIYCRMNNGKSFDFDMLLYVPKTAAEPPPVIIQLNFSGNQAYGPDLDIRPTRAPGDLPGRWHTVGLNPQKRGGDPGRMNYVAAVQRGYAVATACYGEIFPDNLDGFRSSIFTLFYDADALRSDCEIELGEIKAGRRRHIGAIGAWAWGMSRIADALEHEPSVDATRLAVVGHSRLGKAALWAGANDPRFKLVVSNNSGHGGAALSRRIFGETLTMLWHIRANWFCDALCRYAGLEADLPVDQHQLLAMIAPRALYIASSSMDIVADPRSEFRAASYASKIWNLYGLDGLGMAEMPPVDTPIGNMVRYHVKSGKHSITPYDWEQYYKLADKVFGQTK